MKFIVIYDNKVPDGLAQFDVKTPVELTLAVICHKSASAKIPATLPSLIKEPSIFTKSILIF